MKIVKINIIRSWIGGTIFVLSSTFFIVGNAVRFIYWLKCLKVKQCQDTKCQYRQYCRKWIETYSEEEITNLYKILEKYEENFRNQIEMTRKTSDCEIK